MFPLRQFHPGFQVVSINPQLITSNHNVQMTSSFQFVEGLPELCLLSTNVQSSLKWLYHSLICVMLVESSTNLLNGFHLGIAKLLAKSDASHSLISQQMKIRTTLVHKLATSDRHTQQVGKIHARTWRSSTPFPLEVASHAPFVFFLFPWEKLRPDTFWTDLIRVHKYLHSTKKNCLLLPACSCTHKPHAFHIIIHKIYIIKMSRNYEHTI